MDDPVSAAIPEGHRRRNSKNHPTAEQQTVRVWLKWMKTDIWVGGTWLVLVCVLQRWWGEGK